MDLSATLGLDAARAVDPARFAIGGLAPRAALRPVSREETAEALRAAARDGLRVAAWGGGVALTREAAPDRYDLALDLTAMNRIVEYEPADFTVTAECGITIQDLRAALAARGQELPIEAAECGGATLGGALAANASGPRRLRFGAPRDRVLGARFALGDGTLARSGGKVVKNVAGYALHRLMCGARGALGVMLEASLKLAPAPESRAALIYGLGAAELADAARWQGFPRLEPAALTVLGRDIAAKHPGLALETDFTVIVGFEDDAPWVERLCATARERLGAPRLQLSGESAAAMWQTLADFEELPGPRLSFTTAANTPAALAPWLAGGALARAVFHAPAGRLHLFPAEGGAPPLVALGAEHGFALIGARGIEAARALPPEHATLALRRRIRAALDPAGVMAWGDRWASGAP